MKLIQRIKQFSKFFSKQEIAQLCYPILQMRFLSFLGGSATAHGLQDLSFPSRGQTQALAVKAPSPNHWTTKEIPNQFIFVPKITLSFLNESK